jgi:hypothetical protein
MGVQMTREETNLREALGLLAATPGGRRLLQLSLRGIESGGHELASGCWTGKGDAGCLFQQAYWQGVSDGVFDDGRVRAWVSGVAGAGAYHLVIDVIAAFDELARAEFVLERRRAAGARPPQVADRRVGRSDGHSRGGAGGRSHAGRRRRRSPGP